MAAARLGRQRVLNGAFSPDSGPLFAFSPILPPPFHRNVDTRGLHSLDCHRVVELYV